MPDSWGEVSAEVAGHLDIPSDTIMTDEQLAEFQARFHEAMAAGNYRHRVLPQTEVTHRCPAEREGLMSCCGLTPYEVPRTDRMTLAEELVTCDGADRSAV